MTLLHPTQKVKWYLYSEVQPTEREKWLLKRENKQTKITSLF